ncbi:MAG: hypothetical protein KA797_08670 [Chitinophagales bacterium]|nr:hypothetical protein [Chitinophagales bacterium]
MKKLFTSVFALFFLSHAIAGGKDEHDIIKVTKDFNDYTTMLKKAGELEKLFALLDTSFMEEKVVMNLGNEASINTLNMKEFTDYYSRFRNGTDYKVDYHFKKVVRSGASPFFGYVMFTADYKVFIKDSLAYEGDQVQTLYFTKKAGKWKIFKSTLIDTRSKVYISNCPCVMRKIENDRFEVKLRIPFGEERQEYLYTFAFEEVGGGKFYVYMNGDKYLWEGQKIEMKNINNEFTRKKSGKLVVAKTKIEAMQEILQFYNTSACTSINIFEK